MKKLNKIISTAVATVMATVLMGVTVFADDFVFNTEKAKQTYGGGQSFSTFTRLDNERRDKTNFNPLWITEDTVVTIEYTTEGEYEIAPLALVFQSWQGDLVDATEDKWIQIFPTTFTDTVAIFTYDTICQYYGSDFSDVYAINVEDTGDTSIFVQSIVFSNVVVPNEEIGKIGNGIVMRDGVPAEPVIETVTEPVTEPAMETEATTIADIEVTVTTIENAETSVVTSNNGVSEPAEAEDTSKPSVILFVIIGVAVVAVVIVVIVLVTKKGTKRPKGWR